jgi:Rhodopirellula transposase DDE domain
VLIPGQARGRPAGPLADRERPPAGTARHTCHADTHSKTRRGQPQATSALAPATASPAGARFRVLVTGSRVWADTAAVASALEASPVVSVDTKRTSWWGSSKNGGREYQPAHQPEQVNVHDFPDKELGKAIPYGVYDVSADTGWVSAGVDLDTSAFAVQTLRTWWDTVGRSRYPAADRLLICADGGGSNGYRVHAWKVELAAETGMAITVCHLPPGPANGTN